MIGAAFGITPEHAEFPAMREEFLAVYAGNLCVDTRLFPGMDELLDLLDGRGMAWGVVTNKFEHLARSVIDGLGLASRSAVLVGGDTSARAKPIPDPLQHAPEKLALRPASILYLGDEEWDCDCGSRVSPCNHVAAAAIALAQGFEAQAEPGPDEPRADGVVDSPAGIARWAGL
jgi:phosphoglycolate phosphatase